MVGHSVKETPQRFQVGARAGGNVVDELYLHPPAAPDEMGQGLADPTEAGIVRPAVELQALAGIFDHQGQGSLVKSKIIVRSAGRQVGYGGDEGAGRGRIDGADPEILRRGSNSKPADQKSGEEATTQEMEKQDMQKAGYQLQRK